VWRYLRDPMFSRFDTIPECDRHTYTHTHRHTTTAYTALSIAVARFKKSKKVISCMSNFLNKILHGGVDLGFGLQTFGRYWKESKDGEDNDL